jgi:hypothetical protein
MRPQFGASRAWLHQLTCQIRNVRQGSLGTTLSACLLSATVLLAVSACEDQAIGRTCKTLATGTAANQAVFNNEALECPSRLCLQPAYQEMVAPGNTAAFCSAECSKNSDCDEAETRDKSNKADFRCQKSFVCAVPFEVGPLACKKMCVCGDFVDLSKGSKIAVPASCAAKVGS